MASNQKNGDNNGLANANDTPVIQKVKPGFRLLLNLL